MASAARFTSNFAVISLPTPMSSKWRSLQSNQKRNQFDLFPAIRQLHSTYSMVNANGSLWHKITPIRPKNVANAIAYLFCGFLKRIFEYECVNTNELNEPFFLFGYNHRTSTGVSELNLFSNMKIYWMQWKQKRKNQRQFISHLWSDLRPHQMSNHLNQFNFNLF